MCIRDSRVIKEKYASQVTHLTDFYIDLGWRHQYVGIERLLLDGIVIYLVDNEFYFGDRIYLGGEAEGEQYAFFARAILEALPRLDFTPEILHCNDWHTAVLPMLMKTQYAGRMQSRMQTLLTVSYTHLDVYKRQAFACSHRAVNAAES